MNIFVFNCGSSSLKYKVLSMPSEKELCGGEVQRIASKTVETSRIVNEINGNKDIIVKRINSYVDAFNAVMKIVEEDTNVTIDIFAHRLVKGGHVIIGDMFLDEIAYLSLNDVKEFAPIHNPPIIEIIKECKNKYPQIPQAVILDTSFHSTIPDYASIYPVPKKLREELGIKKYGFHGISHRYVSEEAAAYLNIPIDNFNAVSFHLGSGGASLCAIKGGKSIDNSMGFSPLQGLVMSTRCGNIDPSVVLKMAAYSEGDFSKVNKILNKKSGVLGLSGISSDIRDIINKTKIDDIKAQTTFEVYLWRIKKYLGSYLSIIGHTDALIFTDTIGESVPIVRELICKEMNFFGLVLDEESNKSATEFPSDIASVESKIHIMVIKTNEELSIAKRTYQLLDNKYDIKLKNVLMSV